MNRTKQVGLMLGAAAAIVALLAPQPAPAHGHDSRREGAFQQPIEAAMHLPPHVSAILNKACRNCHSNDTQWPWYARLAPVSWMIERDVAKARQAMNLSDWTAHAGRTPQIAVATLAAACADMRSARMPLAGYRLMHPESRLTSGEVDSFCHWTNQQTHALLFSRGASLP